MKKIILLLSLFFFIISCSHAPKQKSNYEIGTEYLQRNRVQAAIPYLDKATVDEPDNFLAFNYLGYAYFQVGKWYNALECFEKSIAINPNDSFAWKWKGEVLSRLGLQKEGQDIYNKGIELEKIENQNKEKQKK